MMTSTTTSPIIIGFSGRKFSGKTTCVNLLTNILLEHYRKKTSLSPDQIVRQYGFADPMKRVCQQFFGLTWEQCYGTNDQKNTETLLQWENFPVSGLAEKLQRHGPMTAREVLQYYGTEILRAMDLDAHVRALMWEIEKDSPVFALIGDVRYPNELQSIHNRGGKIIRLTRTVFPDDTHSSETAMDPENYSWENFDSVLNNDHLHIREQDTLLYTIISDWGIFA